MKLIEYKISLLFKTHKKSLKKEGRGRTKSTDFVIWNYNKNNQTQLKQM